MDNRVQVGRSSGATLHTEVLENLYRFRTEMFYERLKWDVNISNGLEKDQYDEVDPVYLFSHNHLNEIQSCARLLPTTGRYMLREVFSEMLQGEAAPQDATVWELSRFAVIPAGSTEQRQATFHPVTFRMMQEAVDFADHHGIQRYVIVTSVALEKLLRRIGISMRRFGRGTPVSIGNVLSVACWIDINEQTRHAVRSTAGGDIRKEAA